MISVASAIKMLTLNGAYTHFMENEIGSVEVGKFADLVVLSGNPIEYIISDIEKIGEIEPIMTIFDGKIVYEKQGGCDE